MNKYQFKYNHPAPCQIKKLPEIYDKYIGFKEDGFFVEIGAFDGFSWSNTLPLIDAGWSGIMVEPNPQMFPKCAERHKGNKNLILKNVAVGKSRGTTELYLGGSISTIDKDTLRVYQSLPDFNFTGLKDEVYVMVDVYTLDQILLEENCPSYYDVLVLDAEGSEKNILLNYSIKRWTPKLAIVETHALYDDSRLSSKSDWIDEYFHNNGYTMIHEDTINSIYHHEK